VIYKGELFILQTSLAYCHCDYYRSESRQHVLHAGYNENEAFYKKMM